MSDAAPQLVDAAAHLLQARSRGGDQPDGPPPHAVGKAQSHAVDHGCAAIRPHDQQALLGGCLFEGDLIVQGDVVAVEEDVLVPPQRLAGHAGGIAAGHGDEHPLGVGQHLDSGFQALGAVFLLDAWPASGEEFVYLVQGNLGCGLVGGPDDDEQVIRYGGLGCWRQQVALGQDVLVGLGAHHHAGVEDVGQGSQGALQLHEDYGVVIGAAADLHFGYGHQNSQDSANRAAERLSEAPPWGAGRREHNLTTADSKRQQTLPVDTVVRNTSRTSALWRTVASIPYACSDVNCHALSGACAASPRMFEEKRPPRRLAQRGKSWGVPPAQEAIRGDSARMANQPKRSSPRMV